MTKIAFASAAVAALTFAAPAHGDVPGLSPFTGNWAGMRETVGITADGHGRFHHMDFGACPRCAMSDVPYADLDFVITRVAGSEATGTVVSGKYHRFGEQVVLTLSPATLNAPPTMSWTVNGSSEGLFCPAANSGWCGY